MFIITSIKQGEFGEIDTVDYMLPDPEHPWSKLTGNDIMYLLPSTSEYTIDTTDGIDLKGDLEDYDGNPVDFVTLYSVLQIKYHCAFVKRDACRNTIIQEYFKQQKLPSKR